MYVSRVFVCACVCEMMEMQVRWKWKNLWGNTLCFFPPPAGGATATMTQAAHLLCHTSSLCPSWFLSLDSVVTARRSSLNRSTIFQNRSINMGDKLHFTSLLWSDNSQTKWILRFESLKQVYMFLISVISSRCSRGYYPQTSQCCHNSLFLVSVTPALSHSCNGFPCYNSLTWANIWAHFYFCCCSVSKDKNKTSHQKWTVYIYGCFSVSSTFSAQTNIVNFLI